MALKVEFAAADVAWQIEVLKQFPEIANKNFYPAMQRSVRAVRSEVGSRMTFNDRTGATRNRVMSKVSGRGLNITGRYGWWGPGAPIQANILNYGAVAHHIGFVPTLGVQVEHPGLPALHFVEDGYAAAAPDVISEMNAAAAKTVNDLAVK